MKLYLLGMIATAAILGIASAMTNIKSATGGLLRLVGGIYLMFVAISPLAKFDFDAVSDFLRQEIVEGAEEASYGQELGREAMARIIKQECEAYILDKASGYGAAILPDVRLTEDEIPVPESVAITGSVSPYVKARLQQEIETDLNIHKENQTWIGTN